jgi:hypothetical protein
MDDYEFALWHAEISDGKAYTGQLMRIQVCLFTEERLAADKEALKNWLSDPNIDPMQGLTSAEWLLELQLMDHPFNEPRMFERNADDEQTLTIPVHLWRENSEKARLGEKYRDNWDKENIEKKRIRNAEFDFRKELIEEVRGLRRMLRKAGVTDIDGGEVRQNAREAEETERAGRVQFAGETQDFVHMRELRKNAEDRSDKLVAGINERAFLNI